MIAAKRGAASGAPTGAGERVSRDQHESSVLLRVPNFHSRGLQGWMASANRLDNFVEDFIHHETDSSLEVFEFLWRDLWLNRPD